MSMRGALGGPRVLLRRLREVMAEPVSAQERLDKIVVLIAANMVAEVCSVYVLRADGVSVVDRADIDTRPAGAIGELEVGISYAGASGSVALVDDLVVASAPLPSCP